MQDKRRAPPRTHLYDLDAPTLNGIIDNLQLCDVYKLKCTGDKRIICRIAPRRVTTLDAHALLERKLLQSDAPLFKQLVHLKIIPQNAFARCRYPLKVNLLPKTLVTLDAIHIHLSLVPEDDALRLSSQNDDDDEPILPNLRILRVASFEAPLSLLSCILTLVKIDDGNVNFGQSPPRGRYTDLKTILVSADSLCDLNDAMMTLDEWSPTKMTLLESDKIPYLPPSLTDLKCIASAWSSGFLDKPHLLPKSLTRLCVDETIPVNPLRTKIEDLRPHLPRLARLIATGNEEVALANGKFRNFLCDVHAISECKSLHERDISDFMIYELVSRRSLNKTYWLCESSMQHIMRDFPALGFHLVGGGDGFSFEDTLSLRQELMNYHTYDTICNWISQLEPGMFASEKHLICRWILLLPAVAHAQSGAVLRMLRHLRSKLEPRLFRIMLHLVWLIAYKKDLSSINHRAITSVDDFTGLRRLLIISFKYNGFISCASFDCLVPCASFDCVVHSLRDNLFSDDANIIEHIPFALELMEDEALADAACRGLVDHEWFDRFGTWRTIQIFKDLTSDNFEIKSLKRVPRVPSVIVTVEDRKTGETREYVACGSDFIHTDAATSFKPTQPINGATCARERAWLSVRNALNRDCAK